MNKVALIGVGKWGINYYKSLKKLHIQKKINFFILSKLNTKKISSLDSNFKIKIVSNKKLFKYNINNLIISTPPDTHFDIVFKAIKKKIAILIEKPVTMTFKDTLYIKKMVEMYQTPFLVNHQYLLSPFYLKLKKLVNMNKITKIYSEGHGIGPPRDYSSLLDWAPHDLSMIFDLTGMNKKYSIIKVKKLRFSKNFCNWNIQMKIDKINIKISIGNNYKKKSRKFIVYESSGKVAVFNDKNTDKYKLIYNNEKINLPTSLPLDNKIKQFLKISSFYKDQKQRNNYKYLKDINLSLKIAKCIENIYYSY